MNIVVVEDHDGLREALCELLQEQGYSVSAFACAEALDMTPAGPPVDVLIVDLNLPGEDGLSLTRRTRAARPGVGILMTTARRGVADRVSGDENGADLYLPKPVDPAEMLAAVAALRRHLASAPAADPSGSTGALSLDCQRNVLYGLQGEVSICASDTGMLCALARAPGHRLDTDALLLILACPADATGKAILAVRLARLRKKLRLAGLPGPTLQPIRAIDYQLCVPLHLT